MQIDKGEDIMKKNNQEITFSRYLDEKDSVLINKLNTEMQAKLETAILFERSRSKLYQSIEEDVRSKLIFLKGILDDSELITLRERFENDMIKGWSIEYSNNRIKIYASDYPVRIYSRKISSDFDYLNKKIGKNVARLLLQIKERISFTKIFVWIKIYMPISEYDVDNFYYKPIHDGISASGLIEKDTINLLSFGHKGFVDTENPHMEIYIYEENNIDIKEMFE